MGVCKYFIVTVISYSNESMLCIIQAFFRNLCYCAFQIYKRLYFYRVITNYRYDCWDLVCPRPRVFYTMICIVFKVKVTNVLTVWNIVQPREFFVITWGIIVSTTQIFFVPCVHVHSKFFKIIFYILPFTSSALLI